MTESLQIVGAVLILVAFVANTRGAMRPDTTVYLVLNLAGSAVLAWVALEESDWGFLLLEAVWAVVSAWGLLRNGNDPAGAGPSPREE